MTDAGVGVDTTEGADVRQVEAVMDASRVMVAVVAQSIAAAEDVVSLPQLRVLVIVRRHGPVNLSAVARGMGVHPSNATRTCQRLVERGLLDRTESADDRRHHELTLTRAGVELLDSLLDLRRQTFRHLLDRMSPDRREFLAQALEDFAEAAGDTPDELARAFGWLD